VVLQHPPYQLPLPLVLPGVVGVPAGHGTLHRESPLFGELLCVELRPVVASDVGHAELGDLLVRHGVVVGLDHHGALVVRAARRALVLPVVAEHPVAQGGPCVPDPVADAHEQAVAEGLGALDPVLPGEQVHEHRPRRARSRQVFAHLERAVHGPLDHLLVFHGVPHDVLWRDEVDARPVGVQARLEHDDGSDDGRDRVGVLDLAHVEHVVVGPRLASVDHREGVLLETRGDHGLDREVGLDDGEQAVLPVDQANLARLGVLGELDAVTRELPHAALDVVGVHPDSASAQVAVVDVRLQQHLGVLRGDRLHADFDVLGGWLGLHVVSLFFSS